MYLRNKFTLLVVFIISLLMQSCYKESDYLKNSSEILEELTVTIDNSTLSADGSSQTKITYAFPVSSDESLTNLLVITSNGKFKESDNDSINLTFAKLDTSKTKRFSEVTFIASGNAGSSIIRTEVMDYFKNDTITLTDVGTTKIALSPSNFYIKNDTLKEFSLTTALSGESGGVASSGKSVSISAEPSVGLFNTASTLSNGSGNASFTYVFVDTSYVGPISFIAETTNIDGDVITSTANVEVIE